MAMDLLGIGTDRSAANCRVASAGGWDAGTSMALQDPATAAQAPSWKATARAAAMWRLLASWKVRGCCACRALMLL